MNGKGYGIPKKGAMGELRPPSRRIARYRVRNYISLVFINLAKTSSEKQINCFSESLVSHKLYCSYRLLNCKSNNVNIEGRNKDRCQSEKRRGRGNTFSWEKPGSRIQLIRKRGLRYRIWGSQGDRDD